MALLFQQNSCGTDEAPNKNKFPLSLYLVEMLMKRSSTC